MDIELPDFAGEQDPVTEPVLDALQPAPAPEQPQEPAPEAPAAPETAPAEPEDPAAPQPAPEPQHAPLSALLDEREKRQAAERRAAELETWRRQQEEAARRQPAPDRYADPEGWEAYQAAAMQEQFRVMHRTTSKRFALMEHGPDAISAAEKWYDEQGRHDPFFNQKVWSTEDPYGVILAEWKQRQFLAKADPTEFEAFQAWKAQQAGQVPAPTPQHQAQAQPPARPAAPRPSIAASPSAGANANPHVQDGEAVFGEMFGTG